jgi:hypothetical protein
MTEFPLSIFFVLEQFTPEGHVPSGLAQHFHAKCLESDFWLIPLRIEAPILANAKCDLHSQRDKAL